jgi:hypothetical protein
MCNCMDAGHVCSLPHDSTHLKHNPLARRYALRAESLAGLSEKGLRASWPLLSTAMAGITPRAAGGGGNGKGLALAVKSPNRVDEG